MIVNSDETEITQIYEKDATITMESLEKKKIIGSGSFAKVWLMQHKETGTAYAVKIQKKRDVLEKQYVSEAFREKNIMEMIQHPFIVRTVNSFQDINCLYSVLNLYTGGDLSNILLRNQHGIDRHNAQFYGAAVLEALDYLHSKNVIYRDLKPENILLDNDGYCALVDMGLAKVVTGKTYTFCGTPLYIAPEIIMSTGHNKAADIWAFGILIYHMTCGKTPFQKKSSDQMSLFQNIVRGKVVFPSTFDDPDTIDIVRAILDPRQKYRLGCRKAGMQDLRNHGFFRRIDFDKLVCKKLRAPWKPKTIDSKTMNYDDLNRWNADNHNDITLTKEDQDLFEGF